MQCTSVLPQIRNSIENNGFAINPYDLCVAKKLVKRGVIAVVWHFDDLKVSHKYPFEMTKFSQYLSTIYRNKLKVHR